MSRSILILPAVAAADERRAVEARVDAGRGADRLNAAPGKDQLVDSHAREGDRR